jgi:hypothetical protein
VARWRRTPAQRRNLRIDDLELAVLLLAAGYTGPARSYGRSKAAATDKAAGSVVELVQLRRTGPMVGAATAAVPATRQCRTLAGREQRWALASTTCRRGRAKLGGVRDHRVYRKGVSDA